MATSINSENVNAKIRYDAASFLYEIVSAIAGWMYTENVDVIDIKIHWHESQEGYVIMIDGKNMDQFLNEVVNKK